MYSGKKSNQSIRQQVFIKCFELERLIVSCDNLLNIMFGGGVMRNKKLQKGSLIQISREEQLSSPLANFATEIDLLRVLSDKSKASIKSILALPAKPLKHIISDINIVQEKIPSSSSINQPPTEQAQAAVPPSMPFKLKTPLLNLSLKPF